MNNQWLIDLAHVEAACATLPPVHWDVPWWRHWVEHMNVWNGLPSCNQCGDRIDSWNTGESPERCNKFGCWS